MPASFADDAARQKFVNKAIKDGYYKEAKEVMEFSISSASNANAYASLGTTRFNLKNYAGAIEAWTKLGELDATKAAIMQNNIGNALRDSKKPEESKAAYDGD